MADPVSESKNNAIAAPPRSMQTHYTVAQIAKSWGISPTTALRMFKLEPGVLRIGNVHTRKRTKIMLRIPQEVADRVWERTQRDLVKRPA